VRTCLSLLTASAIAVGALVVAGAAPASAVSATPQFVQVARNQTSGSNSYTFQSWSDGDAQQHTIVVPSTAQTYAATYSVSSTPRPIAFVQVLKSGDQILGISCWRSGEDMQRYLELEATREFYGQLPPLLMGTPSIRTYEVVRSLAGGGASDVLDWMNA